MNYVLRAVEFHNLDRKWEERWLAGNSCNWLIDIKPKQEYQVMDIRNLLDGMCYNI